MLGDEIRKARIAAAISQEELAFRAKISRNYVSMLELNANSPTVDVLLRIASALGVRASAIIARIEEPPPKAPRK
jgi:transcriptional regulator with XRE-family HTH domain